MFPVHSFNHFVPAPTAPSLVFHHPHGLILPRNRKNQIFTSTLSNLVAANSVEFHSEPIKKRGRPPKQVQGKSYTVSYLINSCGLSPVEADAISAKIHLVDSENPNAVLALLEKYGFDKAQIAVVVKKFPRILLCGEKILLPKLEFFQFVAMSKDLLPSVILKNPAWLMSSLDNKLVPIFKFLRSILLTDEKALNAMRHWIYLSESSSVETRVVPNIMILRELETPEACIRLLLSHHPLPLFLETDEFKERISYLLEMGFTPLTSNFVLGLHVTTGKGNRLAWSRCYEAYREWGWLKEDIQMAFRLNPLCMLMSQNKLSRMMDFFVNKMGLDARIVAETPGALKYSFEKRVLPRCSVIQVLLSRGFINKDFKLTSVLFPMENHFLDKYVFAYENEIPNLYDFYKGDVGIEEL